MFFRCLIFVLRIINCVPKTFTDDIFSSFGDTEESSMPCGCEKLFCCITIPTCQLKRDEFHKIHLSHSVRTLTDNEYFGFRGRSPTDLIPGFDRGYGKGALCICEFVDPKICEAARTNSLFWLVSRVKSYRDILFTCIVVDC